MEQNNFEEEQNGDNQYSQDSLEVGESPIEKTQYTDVPLERKLSERQKQYVLGGLMVFTGLLVGLLVVQQSILFNNPTQEVSKEELSEQISIQPVVLNDVEQRVSYCDISAEESGVTRDEFIHEFRSSYSRDISMYTDEDLCLTYFVMNEIGKNLEDIPEGGDDYLLKKLVEFGISDPEALRKVREISEISVEEKKDKAKRALVKSYVFSSQIYVGSCLDTPGGIVSAPQEGKVFCDDRMDTWPMLEENGASWGGCNFFAENVDGEYTYQYCATYKNGDVLQCTETGCTEKEN